ncbi:hypothetical protein KIH74_01795 [Kineosporia sp. J2-2]|uniref:histidine kinase n=1 Tax=Kineosporia corallincola TaxID=2835133 RepID=A0ABS5TBY8_9ACTN|nr:ATP-binding protein [Kineosporia corallincola]MBT0767638.1 hypothetical protein [Kineosporia corallincola]
MKIAQKLGLLVGALLAAVLTTGLILSSQLASTSKEYQDLIDGNIQQREASRTMLVAFGQQVTAFQQILLQARTADDYARLKAEYEEQAKTVDSLNDELLKNVTAEDPRLKTMLEQFQTSHSAVGSQYTAALAAFEDSNYEDIAGVSASVEGLEEFPNDLVNIIADYRTRSAEELIASQNATASDRLRLIIIGGVLLLLLATAAAVIVVRGITRPVRSLTNAALTVANERMPRVVSEISTMAGDAEPPSLPRFQVTTKDELSTLASALTTLQNSAVDLALEQRRNELANAETLVNLGRRNQSLMTRMLGYVTELERDESNPASLDKLFRLDHLTTRIRRNAESLLVLAGAKQTRTWSHPIAMQDVLRAALSEIEEYNRVTVHHMDHAKVSGSVAADLTHMLAELLENATRFSPRERQVQVVGRLIPSGYQFDVIDAGLGMTAEELSEANERIAEAGQRRPDAKVLGLHVVGRIASRRDMLVYLLPSDQVGLTAQVLVPAAVISDAKLPTGFDQVTEVPMLSSPKKPEPAQVSSSAPALAPTPRRNPGSTPNRPMPQPAQREAVQPFPAGPSAGQMPQLTPGNQGRAIEPAAQASAPARRVRGAQLGDLGIDNNDSAPRVDPNATRSQLSSFQSGNAAARQSGNGTAPGSPATPGNGAPRRESGPLVALPSGATPQPTTPWPLNQQNQPLNRRTPQQNLPQNLQQNPQQSAPNAPSQQSPGPVRRVRGAQLGELGALDSDQSAGPVDPNRVRSQMSSLQSGVAAARRGTGAIGQPQAGGPAAPSGDRSQNPPTTPVRRVRGAQLGELDTGTGGAFRGLPRDAAGIGRQLSNLQAATTRATQETGRIHATDDETMESN